MDFQAIGAAKDAARMGRITSFYEKLPRGQAVAETSSNPIEAYRIKHFGEKGGSARTLDWTGTLEFG